MRIDWDEADGPRRPGPKGWRAQVLIVAAIVWILVGLMLLNRLAG